MTIDAVSDRLLLSTRQVRGLETGETSAFHNTAFYGRALEKYAAFLGVAPVGVGPAPPAVLGRRAAAAEQPRLSLAAYPSGHDINPRRARASLTVAVALGTCLVLGILVFWRRVASVVTSGTRRRLNCFGVTASQSLAVWRRKGWIHRQGPRGWFQ